MPHNCKALVICCIDFRFQSALRDFLISTNLKDQYDLVCLGGVTKGLVEGDKAGSEIILKQIGISKKLHSISELYLIHHMDCGAYGGHAAFENIKAERDKQLTDLISAKKIIAKEYLDLVINKVLARIDDKNNIDFEIIS